MQSVRDALLPISFSGGLLRRVLPSDLPAFQAYRAIPELGRYQAWSPMSETEALAFLNEMHTAHLFTPGKWLQLGIVEPGTERLIGDIGLFLAADERTAEIGFTLEPPAQGRGIATAAVRAALQLLFAATAVQHVLGITDSRNTASVRLLKRAGFQHKESRHASFRGEPCSEDVYVLPRNELSDVRI
jgi:RimJ/RimL family protein N-acetyltransferase